MALPGAAPGGVMSAPERPPRGDRDARAAARRRWAAVRATVEAALEHPPEARADFLDRACGDDAELRAEIEAQLRACERAAESPEFLAESATAFAAPLFTGNTVGDQAAGSGAMAAGSDAMAADESVASEPAAGMPAALRTALA